jgi:uncharacterized iron-regulated membrane protein
VRLAAVATMLGPQSGFGQRGAAMWRCWPLSNALVAGCALPVIGLAIMLAAIGIAVAGAAMFWKRGAPGGHAAAACDLRSPATASLATSALPGGLTACSAVKTAPALAQCSAPTRLPSRIRPA